MTWGFPLVRKSKATGVPRKPKPVNNERADKLGTAFWRDSFNQRQCLIRETAWAQAEGPCGEMTHTWYALPDQEIFAVAGVGRPTPEWDSACSMVMVDDCEKMADTLYRMPAVLAPENYTRWTGGTPVEAAPLLQVWQGPLVADQIAQAWFKRATSLPFAQGHLL